MKKDYNYLKARRWVDSIYKLNNQLEKLLGKMPEQLTKADKANAQIEIDHLFRLATRLESQVKNAAEVDESKK